MDYTKKRVLEILRNRAFCQRTAVLPTVFTLYEICYINSESIYNVTCINLGGGGQEFFFSDFRICMSQSDMLRMAKPWALIGGFGGMLPEKFFKTVQFGAC